MNWKKVMVWTLLLLAATFMGGFIPGVFRGVYQAGGGTAPAWTSLLQAVLVPGAILLVFFFFARDQHSWTITHAYVVWLLANIFSLVNFAIGMTITGWLVGMVSSAVFATVGAALGRATISKQRYHQDEKRHREMSMLQQSPRGQVFDDQPVDKSRISAPRS